MTCLRILPAVSVMAACLFAMDVSPVRASITMELGGIDFAGAGAMLPDDALTLVFDDSGGPGIVRLTIDGANLPAGTAKLKDVVFNIDPLFAGGLTFSHVSGVETNGVPTFSQDSINGWGPAGSFDIEFSFKTSGPLGDFFPSSESVFDITGTGLVADDFRSASTGSDSQIAAFHLNTTGNGQSGK